MREDSSINEGERQAMIHSMMDQLFGGMGVAEKKEMVEAMMEKMTEGLDMKEMMRGKMTGMMSASGDSDSGGMQDMMTTIMHGGSEQHMSQMPEMMLKSMMPHCIGMMLPAIDAGKRGEVAAAILSTLIDKGTAGMSDEQAATFRATLDQVLHP